MIFKGTKEQAENSIFSKSMNPAHYHSPKLSSSKSKYESCTFSFTETIELNTSYKSYNFKYYAVSNAQFCQIM